MDWDGVFAQEPSSIDWGGSLPWSLDSGSSSSSPTSPSDSSMPSQQPLDPPAPSSDSTLDLLSREPANSRRLTGKNFFLTYSRTPLTRQEVLTHLEKMGTITSAVIAQETHQPSATALPTDQTEDALCMTHVHAFVMFEKKRDVVPAAFDVSGVHPNVRIPNAYVGTIQESWVKMWNYCLKEDKTPLIVGQPPSLKRSRSEISAEALALAETESVASALVFLVKELPFEMLTKWTSMENSLQAYRTMKVRQAPPSYQLDNFLPVVMPVDWHSLLLTGPTGIGKTQFARALLPKAPVIRHVDQLRTADLSNGIIFDDFDVSHWPVTSIIHLLDWDEASGIHCRYTHVLVPAHTKKIFTHNKPLHQWLPADIPRPQYEAVERRIILVELTTRLFH